MCAAGRLHFNQKSSSNIVNPTVASSNSDNNQLILDDRTILNRLKQYKEKNKENPALCHAMENVVMRDLGYEDVVPIVAGIEQHKSNWIKEKNRQQLDKKEIINQLTTVLLSENRYLYNIPEERKEEFYAEFLKIIDVSEQRQELETSSLNVKVVKRANVGQACDSLLQDMGADRVKDVFDKIAVWQAEIQANAIEFGMPLEDLAVVAPEIQSQANINSEETKSSGSYSLLNNLNGNTNADKNTNLISNVPDQEISENSSISSGLSWMPPLTGDSQNEISNSNKIEKTAPPAIVSPSDSVINVGSLMPWSTFSYSSSVSKAKKLTNTNSKNVTQAKGPFVISGWRTAVPSISYLSESFTNATRNIGDAIRQIPSPMLFTQRMTTGARGIAQFITNTSRAGIVNGLQQLARTGCSPDGTGRIRPWFLS